VGDLLLRKLALCRTRIDKIRRALPAIPEELLSDERTEAFVAFNLFLLIQDPVRMAREAPTGRDAISRFLDEIARL
jgi:hypothetical protein